MEDSEFTMEELARCRETTDRLLKEAAELRSTRDEPDGLVFDWEPPSLTNPTLLTFIAEVHCRGDKSKFQFTLDIAQLQTAGRTSDLQKLNDILVARHAGIDNRRSLLHALEWMLEISLEQTAPELSRNERLRQARRLLFLTDPEPRAIGVSPLLVCVRQRARNRLWKRHHIDISELERESEELYLGLEQFEERPFSPDLRARAAAYDGKLLDHHQRVKAAGKLLGGQVGNTLVAYAEFLIERLLRRRTLDRRDQSKFFPWNSF
jgi:hypothetical protein